MSLSPARRNLLWISLFATAFAFVESSVVVYLRAIYYPDRFTFPLKLISDHHLIVELVREAATIVMLAVVGILAGSKPWEKFAYFLVAFGVWDIFYYIWLKVALDWPSAFTDWDILFLIPLPWIGPVIAPVAISFIMITCGSLIVIRVAKGQYFHPSIMSWVLASCGTIIFIYSFMSDIGATLGGQLPAPYGYWFLVAGVVLYVLSYIIACIPAASMRIHD
jgi:hypothetical protein